MTYAPPKAKREYIGALWKRKQDGTRGALVTHKCARCGVTHDSERNGVWFERADSSGLWRWVCAGCCGYPAEITQKSRKDYEQEVLK